MQVNASKRYSVLDIEIFILKNALDFAEFLENGDWSTRSVFDNIVNKRFGIDRLNLFILFVRKWKNKLDFSVTEYSLLR